MEHTDWFWACTDAPVRAAAGGSETLVAGPVNQALAWLKGKGWASAPKAAQKPIVDTESPSLTPSPATSPGPSRSLGPWPRVMSLNFDGSSDSDADNDGDSSNNEIFPRNSSEEATAAAEAQVTARPRAPPP